MISNSHLFSQLSLWGSLLPGTAQGVTEVKSHLGLGYVAGRRLYWHQQTVTLLVLFVNIAAISI